ncbi:NAD(P)/FAD-dependent oxidoreductase [Streptomyces murinus]|uniref:NAD(P)/FAD-dependent oxidoreductase n=1 Tax=Streptomyces murinus TaxID=33900 RepID=UPI00380D2713
MTAESTSTARYGHGVVIGAGIAGLLVARALSDHFRQVTVLERDDLPERPTCRPGVPQGRHVHGLLARGAAVLEEFFPGVLGELDAAGAPVVDCCHDIRFQFPSGRSPQVHSGILVRAASRQLLEHVLRRRVASLERVTIRSGCPVVALRTGTDRRKVTGVWIQRRAGQPRTAYEAVDADLVIDASGRSSRLPHWLVDLGLPRAQETVIDAGVGYATRVFRARPGSPANYVGVIEPLVPTTTTQHGCFVTQVEDARILVTLQCAHERPPHTDIEFSRFVESLQCSLSDSLAGYQPDDLIYRYSRNANRRIHYSRLREWPEGIIALGDAVCAFNPIYGQGMTVAALEALTLDNFLAHSQGLAGFSARYQRAVARLTAWPWFLATIADRGRQSGPASATSRLGGWYLTRLQHLIPNNPDIFIRFVQVMHMIANPATLVHPSVLLRVIAPRTAPRA